MARMNALAHALPASRIAYAACPLCESARIAFLREDDCTRHPLYRPIVGPRIAWMRCEACTHVFTRGYFTPQAASEIFSSTLAHQTPGADAEAQRYVSARMVERVARHVAGGAWLDVGFGNASLLMTAAEWGFEAVGLDLRPQCVAALRALGFEAHASDVAKLDAPGRFMVISMADVLEHMPYPREGLAAAHRLLAPGGVLFASMPNMGSPLWKLLDAQQANPYWGELEHFHNFSRERLFALLGEAGFTPLAYDVSHRYRACMEVIARREAAPQALA